MNLFTRKHKTSFSTRAASLLLLHGLLHDLLSTSQQRIYN